MFQIFEFIGSTLGKLILRSINNKFVREKEYQSVIVFFVTMEDDKYVGDPTHFHSGLKNFKSMERGSIIRGTRPHACYESGGRETGQR